MQGLNYFSKIYLYRDPVDMRKSINGLSMIVLDELSMSFTGNVLFAFVSRNGKIIKLIYWDQTGFALWLKHLEKDRFIWPKKEDKLIIDCANDQLMQLLQGFNVFQKPHEHLVYEKINK